MKFAKTAEKNEKQYLDDKEKLSNELEFTTTLLNEKEIAYERLIRDNKEINNTKNIYEKMIRSLRLMISNESTKLKESYLLLEEARQKALQSDKLKSAFLAVINHEIRTPINGILGFSQFLVSPSLSPERRQEYTEILNKSTSRFIDTFNDIIYYSQIKSGDIEISISTFDVNLLVANIVNQAQDIKRQLNKNLEINVVSNLTQKKYIRGFENGYFKILYNLVANAIKFTKVGSVNIEYVISNSKIKFIVADTGIGFDQKRKDTIFESFTQDEQSLSRHFEGAGLGLSICKGLVNLMNGEIGVESHVNIGSSFWVEIPLLEEKKEENNIYDAIESHINKQKHSGIILVATPADKDFCTIKTFCNSYNFEVQQVKEMDEIIKYFKSGKNIIYIIVEVITTIEISLRFAREILDEKPDARLAFIVSEKPNETEKNKIMALSDIIIYKPLSSLALSKLLNY